MQQIVNFLFMMFLIQTFLVICTHVEFSKRRKMKNSSQSSQLEILQKTYLIKV